MSEKKIIEKYLQDFCVEEYLDEIINNLVIERPKNPYMAIARSLETKTLAEIIDITITPIITKSLRSGVKCVVTTNIASFSGICSYQKTEELEAEVEPKDFTMVQERVKEFLVGLDPKDQKLIDEKLAEVEGINTAEMLSVSIACCRAGARHSAIPCHQYICKLTEQDPTVMKIPVPVIAIASRIVGNTTFTQDICLTPIKSSSIASAIEQLMNSVQNISKSDCIKKPVTLSSYGCPLIESNGYSNAYKMIASAVQENGLNQNMKLGLSYKSEKMVKIPTEEGQPFTYAVDDISAAPKVGNDIAEIINTNWQESECIMIEDPIHYTHIGALQLLKKRIADTIAENRTAESGKLKYCVDGIGGSANCHLQVVINTTSFNAIQDIDYLKDTPYTTVKLQFSKVRSVSEAVSLVKKSKLCSLKVIVGSNDDNAVEETLETFAVDFAVGIGAGQFLGGGINSAEFYTKYNRLQEISAENPKIPFAGSKFVC